MVFESIVADVLNKVLHDYVVNLDSKQLKIGIWGGDVVLNDLQLRENALDEIDLPLQLVHGSLGKLVLKIPWKNLYGEPVEAQIDNFYGLVVPKQAVPYDAEKEAKYDMQEKMAALQKLEEARKMQEDKDKPQPDKTFSEKLTAQIINNLQVKISNIHLRYEDTTTTGKTFAFGVTLKELVLHTTNSDWEKCYMSQQIGPTFKIATLDSLSFYMNCDGNLYQDKISTRDSLINMFTNNIAHKDNTPTDYHYMVGPISSVAKLKLNMNPEFDNPPFIIPKVHLSINMEKLKVGITSTQFQNILKLADTMNRLQLGQPYRKYRPFNMPFKNHYKEWWHFAIKSVLEEHVRKRREVWNWEYIKNHRELCRTYAKALKERKLTKKPPANVVGVCTLCEQKLDIFNIILVNNRVQVELDILKKEEEEHKAVTKKRSWLGSWWSTPQQEERVSSDDIVKQFEAALNEEEKLKLYEAIGYQENSAQILLPESYEAIKMKFTLEALEIGVYDDIYTTEGIRASYKIDKRAIMLLNFDLANCDIIQRPATNSFSCCATVKELKLIGLEIDGRVPVLIASQLTDELPLLSVFFETNPLDKKCDQRLKVLGRPLQIVYDTDTIEQLVRAYTPPHQLNLSEIEEAASEKMADFKQRSATGMQYIVDTHLILEVDIRFMPNIVILPYNGRYIPEGHCSMLVFNLGELRIVSEPRGEIIKVPEQTLGNWQQEEMFKIVEQQSYDKFRLTLEDIQLIVSKSKENWEYALNNLCEMHILERTSVIVTVHVCIVSDDPRLPKTRVTAVIPSINISITEDRVLEALRIVLSIPIPQSDEIAPIVKTNSTMAASRTSISKIIDQELLKVKQQKAITQDEFRTDVIQYTSLEVTFELKNFDINIYKFEKERCDDTPSDKYRTPVEELSPDEGVFADAVTGTASSYNEDHLLLKFNVLQLEGYMAQRTYELTATLKLQDIKLIQYDRADKTDNELYIISTPKTKEEDCYYLLSVFYLMANKKSPEFNTKYNSTEQLVKINFAKAIVHLHQERLLTLLQFVNDFQCKLLKLTNAMGPKDRYATADQTNFVTKLATIAEEFDDTEDRPIRKSLKYSAPKIVDCIKFKVHAKLDQVSLRLSCRKRSLALLQVQDCFAGVILKTSYTELTFRLKNVFVIDLNPLTVHPIILSIIGEDALKCQIVLFNTEETSIYNSDDLKIDATIGCMRIVFLNWFVTSVLSFLNCFQTAQDALINASAAAADAAKQNAINAYEKATRIKMNIKIHAPVIIVPIDSSSTDAISLDLGFLKLSNTTNDIVNESMHTRSVLIDEIRLELTNLTVSKIDFQSHNISKEEIRNFYEDYETHSSVRDINEKLYGVKSYKHVLNPISFVLIVKRNLMSSWCKDYPEIDVSGHLRPIKLNISNKDYVLIISILSKNFSEGQQEFKKPPTEHLKCDETTTVEIYTKSNENAPSPIRKDAIRKSQATKSVISTEKPKIYEQFKFSFQFDGIILKLDQENGDDFAEFGMHFLSLKGKMLVDGTLSTSIVLCDIQIEDKRPDLKSSITKYLCRKDWKPLEPSSSHESHISENVRESKNYMIELTSIIKENDTFVELRICGFDLIITIDFLMQLAYFFTNPEQIDNDTMAMKASAKAPKKTVAVVEDKPVEKNLNLLLYIEEPDIILIENLEDFHTNAIIFNAQVRLNYRALNEKQIISGQIDGLRMYMCAFMPEKRETTKHYILHPCVISVQGSTPDEEGLHINIKSTDIIVNVSPAAIELLNKALTTMALSRAEKVNRLSRDIDYSDIWDKSTYSEKEYWFLVDPASEVLEVQDLLMEQPAKKTEKCILEVPSISFVFETGVGYYTTPMVSAETKLLATVTNWSHNMKVTGNLSLFMNYYNNNLGVWEPLIEQLEKVDKNGMSEYTPWELNFGMESIAPENSDEVNVEPTNKITIESDEMLEITVSKSALDTIHALGESFSYAMDVEGLSKPAIIAPYIVENDTGFDITLNFSRGMFTLHECHMPQSKCETLNRHLVFQHQNATKHVSPETVRSCTISSGGKVYMQTRELSLITESEDEAYNIYITIGNIQREIVIPVSRTDSRYFALQRATNRDPWGIVSQVVSEFGTTRINIHGVVNIENHFTMPITIYRQKTGENEFRVVGIVEAGTVFHVPLHAIYADFKELHFSLPGYKKSIQGIKWNDAPTDFQYQRQVQCDPLTTFEPIYINVTRLKTDIFHETSMKHTLLSAYYTIHLRPPLYLRNALPVCIRVSVAGCSVARDDSKDHDNNQTDEHDAHKSLIKEDLLDYGEKEVHPGHVLHLPTVQLTSRKRVKSYIVVRLIQYLEKDWSCTTEISETHDEFVTWVFTSYDSIAKMDIDLGVRFQHLCGSITLTVYSPFWMVNKTGLMLSYQAYTDSQTILYHPPEYNGPILFSFREKFFFDKKRASIRVDNGEWSEKIPMEVSGSKGKVTCAANDQTYHIGVHNQLTQNSLTKQITFIPFYMLINRCDFPIEVQEHSRPADPWLTVNGSDCIPFWPKATSTNIILKVEEETTVPFNFTEGQCVLLKLNKNKNGGICVDVHVTEGGIYISVTPYNVGDAPGLLINYTSQPVQIQEKGTPIKIILEPYERLLFTWADPAGSRILLLGKDKAENGLRADGVGEVKLNNKTKAYWVSFLHGLQRAILFTESHELADKVAGSADMQKINQEIEMRIHGIGFSLLNNATGTDILYLGIRNSGIIWESKKSAKKRFKQLKMELSNLMEEQYQAYLLAKEVNKSQKYYIDQKYEVDFDKMIFTKSAERTIRRTFYPGLWFHLKTSPFQLQLHAKINKIQIDNQMSDCIFPVVLAPIPPPKSIAATSVLKPFVECSIVERVVPHSSINQFKYCTMLIQEFHFKVDILFLSAIAEMFTSEMDDEQAAKLFNQDIDNIEKPLLSLVELHSAQEHKNFYDNLHLGPLKIHVSFSMAGSDTTALPGILSSIVQGVGVTLTDVNDVVFKLAFFEREYGFFTQQQLISEITTHYAGQAVKQLYVLVLGLDVLGNPYGLVVGFKTGVQDLFYEPFQGAIQGPGEFAEGLVLGVRSLFGHTVGGAAGAVSKITGAMGKGLAALTFDEEYQKKRRQALNKKPANFQEGIARSGKGLVMGVVDGVSGVFTKPISGAREEGVEGFFKGLGKGAIGLVARPTAGVVDFASGSFEAVKRATENAQETQRLRPPRFMHLDNVLRPYSLPEAMGSRLLKEIEKGKYATTDSFVHCEVVVEKHEILLLSNHRVIYTTKNELFGVWGVQWTYLWRDIRMVVATDRGVEIVLSKESKKMLGLISYSETNRKIIPIAKRSRREHVASLMESLRGEL